MTSCIFCEIIAGKVESKIFYHDQEICVFHDISPEAPIHFLIVPVRHIINLYDCQPQDGAILAKILLLAPSLAAQAGANGGFRLVFNNGEDARQEVQHLHAHVLGGPHPWKQKI